MIFFRRYCYVIIVTRARVRCFHFYWEILRVSCLCLRAHASAQCECALAEFCHPPLCGEHSICDSDSEVFGCHDLWIALLAPTSKLGKQFNAQRLLSGSTTPVAFSLIVSTERSHSLCLYTSIIIIMIISFFVYPFYAFNEIKIKRRKKNR